MSKFSDKLARTLKGKMSSISRGNSILHNNAVLYTVFAIALVNFFTYLSLGDIRHSIIFLLTGFVVSFVSKNMVVILCISMAITNIVKVASGSREGMEDGAESKEEVPAENKEPKEPNEPKEETKEKKETENKNVEESMNTIKEDGKKLIEVQDKIIDGFNQIEPYMEKAEKLANKIDNTASKLKDVM